MRQPGSMFPPRREGEKVKVEGKGVAEGEGVVKVPRSRNLYMLLPKVQRVSLGISLRLNRLRSLGEKG